MAATVEGLFKIIDGASGPMRKMELQAKKTDRSFESLGERLDHVGSDQQLKQMGQVDQQIKTMDRDARTFSSSSGGGGRLSRTLHDSGNESDRLSTKLGRVGISLASIGKIFSAMKMPLMVSGIVALVQGVSALAGGAVSLLPKLTDLAGVAGALPATFLGVGLGIASAKLAISGLKPALAGTTGAMAKLTPRAREFVRVLREMKPIGNQLKSSAQAGLFPGLTAALSQLKTGVPTARGLLKKGGETVGGIADRAAGAFTQPGFLKDLQSVGGQGLTVLNRLGSALINVIEAFRHVAVAAQPFTEWISKTVLGWTQMLEQSALTGRRTGDLGRYFDRTRATLEQFGSILKNLWETFKGVGEAARPLGDSLWESADKATSRWARFANSLEGQSEMRNYFEGLKESIQAIFHFVGELGKAFVDMGSGSGFKSTADTLTRALKPLESLFKMVGESYGPALAKTLEQLIVLFDNLGGGSSVLLHVVELLNMFLEAVNGLLQKIPGLNNLIVGVLGAFALRSLSTRIMDVARSWGMVATEAGNAAVAQRGAAASGGLAAAGGVGVVGGVRGAGRRLVGPQGRVFNTRPNTSFIAGPIGAAGETEAVAAGGSRLFGGAGMLGAAGLGLRAAGRFFLPLAGFMAATDFATTPGDVGERFQGMLSGASMGFIPGPVSDSQRREQATTDQQAKLQKFLGHVPTTRKGMIRAAQSLKRQRRQLGGNQLGLRDSSNPEVAEGLAAGLSIKQMRAQGFDTHNDIGDTARQQQITKGLQLLTPKIREQSREAGAGAASDFSKAWAIRLKDGNRREAGDAMLQPLLAEMRKIGPQGARILAQSNLAFYRQAAKDNPKLTGQYHEAAEAIERSFSKMGEHVRIINGQIFDGSKSEWKSIADAIGSQAERAEEETSSAFTKIQQQAIGSLIAMGYNRTQATNIVQGMEKGGSVGRAASSDASSGPNGSGQRKSVAEGNFNKAHGYAYGGYRVPGFGNQDRYALGGGGMGAAGELVVNKHTENDANSILGRYGMSLGGMVGKEGRPHSELAYARGGRRPAAGGGIESVGKYAQSRGLSVSGGPGFGGIPTSGHVSDSLHYSGLAYDVSGAPNLMMSFRKAAEARYLGHGLNELFYDPYSYYIDQGNKVPGSIGGHSDHVHIGFFPGGPTGASAVKGMLGAGGMGSFKALKAQKSKLGGVPGALANAAMGAMTAGMNKKLAAKAGLTGSVAGPIPGGAVGGSRSAVERAIAQTLFAHGANKTAAAGIIGNAWRESKMDPSAEGTGGGGLFGFTAGAISLANLKAAGGKNWANPVFQTQFMLGHGGQGLIPSLNASGSPEAAAALFMNQWERPGIPAQAERESGARAAFQQGYSKGGRMPSFAGWFGNGGTVEASGPTLMGIGESGHEVATVRPKGKGRAGAAGGISIGHMSITNNRPGDVRKQIKREVHEAFSELADELELQPHLDDSELL